MKTYGILLIGICWAMACENNGQTAATGIYGVKPSITTSAAYYRAGYTGVTIENNTSEDMTVETCGGVLYHTREKLLNGEWILASIYNCGGHSMETTAIGAHAAASFDIYVAKPGTYRFRIPFSVNGSSADAVSNEFVVY